MRSSQIWSRQDLQMCGERTTEVKGDTKVCGRMELSLPEVGKNTGQAWQKGR